jgi:ribosomal protein L11 methyltransferase
MQHKKITFNGISAETSDILIAMLSDAGYSGFEEADNQLLAYIDEAEFDGSVLQQLATSFSISFDVDTVAQQNWNALWESNFQPVIIDGICTIQAHFHNIQVNTPYNILITPKMSFGTGHHATTRLMITLMNETVLKNRSVLDFGTGTGVLAIFASYLGAEKVVAIDNDEWSVENAKENVQRNDCNNIDVLPGSLEDVTPRTWDVILANINRHILLHYMADLYCSLNEGGTLLLSGLLEADEPAIRESAEGAGFRFLKIQKENGWIAFVFGKA